jgi:hypothetical protein
VSRSSCSTSSLNGLRQELRLVVVDGTNGVALPYRPGELAHWLRYIPARYDVPWRTSPRKRAKPGIRLSEHDAHPIERA